MKNIVVFVKNLTSGGAEKQSILLAKVLSNDYNVHYIVFNGDKLHQKYLEILQQEELINICVLSGCYFSRFYKFLIYLKINKIDAIFSYLTAANAYASIASLFHKMLLYPGLRNNTLPTIKMLVDRFITNHLATFSVSNSNSGKNNFVKSGFDEKKIVVINNCLEFIDLYKEKISSPEFTIITVGRFVPQKDYETAIKAISELKKNRLRFHFDIVGFGKLEKHIRFLVSQYEIEDITSIHINPNNIPDLLENANIYLSTSLFEGMSNSIMEGMNANLPIVCTNVGDNSSLVVNQINGFLTDIKDSSMIANKLEFLIKNPQICNKMGKASKKILLEKYSMLAFKKKYIDLIKDLF